jgi:cobalt-zinc-cadmium efflux system outer membrane protein
MQNRLEETRSRPLAILLLIFTAGSPMGCAFKQAYQSGETSALALPAGGSTARQPGAGQASVFPPATPTIKPQIVAASFQSSGPGGEDTSVKGAAEVLPIPSKAQENVAPADSRPKTADTAPAVAFDQVISATLLADPKIRAGLESINQARADLRTSSLFPNPSFLSDGIFIPLQRWTPARPGGPPQIDEQLSYPIDWFLFGKRAAAMVSANLGVRQSEADYADLVRQRVRDSAVAFYDVLEAKGLVSLARQDTEALRRLEAATAKAVKAGGRPVVDLNRVRLDLLKSEQDLREAETALVTAKAKLRSFMGRTDLDPSFDVSGTLDVPKRAETPSAEEAFGLAQANRPDIQSLRWRISKARADVVVEDRKSYPQITPMAGYTRQFQTEVLGVADADSLTVSVTATLPLFDRNQGGRMKARSVAVQNGLNLEAGLVDLRAEIEQAVQELRTAYENAGAVAEEQLKLAGEVRDSITKAYGVGGRPLIDVLDAERNYRETYRLYVTSRAGYWRSLYKFSAVIGKQVSPDDEHPRR